MATSQDAPGSASHSLEQDQSVPPPAYDQAEADLDLSQMRLTDQKLATNSTIHGEPSAPTSDSPTDRSKWKTAFEDVRHFAGGLISHPYESTKHYSILRHSHGLVYYRGSYTNLAISIFSDSPLPENRTLWLQRKGWSGKTGLKAGTLLGTKGAWINVTPTTLATADKLPPSDERAWQRDIKKFLDKAPKELRRHQIRETCVLRIPPLAEDGYLRVVLCVGEKSKKVLCPSPVFRLASTSLSSSSIRGASLSKLPLELGLKVASNLATTAALNASAPVTGMVSNKIAQYQPTYLTREAATTAYDASGIADNLNKANKRYDTGRDGSDQESGTLTYDEFARPDVIGEESGPQSPYPVRFSGKVVPGSGRSKAEFGMPTANLVSVSDEVLLRYEGIYFGWAQISMADKKLQSEVPEEWLQAIIFIIPCPDAKSKVIAEKSTRVYILHDFHKTPLLDAKVSVLLMGFLRPCKSLSAALETADTDEQLFEIYKDIAITEASLNRPEWAADATLMRIKMAASNRSLTERYVDLRTSGHKQIDRVPLHKAGIRTGGAVLRDRLVGTGGVYVHR